MYNGPYSLYSLSSKCERGAERISWKAVCCVGVCFNEKLPQVILTHRQSGQLFTGQDVPEDLSDPMAGYTNTSSGIWTWHSYSWCKSSTCLLGCNSESSAANCVSSLIPSWCLATHNRNAGQVMYVCACICIHRSAVKPVSELLTNSTA